MAFTQKTLAADFTLANGTFSGGGNSYTAQNLRMSARIEAAGEGYATMGLAIWGLSLDVMRQLTVLPTLPTAVGDNSITLRVGENGTADQIIYQGTIRSAFVDGTSQPNVAFRVQCQSGLLEQVKPVPAISYPGTSDVATVMGQIAKSMGRTLENSGVDVKLSNVNLPGSAGQQAAALARHAGIQWTLDTDVLAIWPTNQPRQGDAVLVSPETGLVGYPAFTAYGLILTTLFQATLKFGAKIHVQSQLKPACGDWYALRTEYQLDCQVPNGRWFAVIETGRINPR